VLSGDGETQPNQEQVLQIALEICKEDVLSLFVQNLPSLGWGVCHLSTRCIVMFLFQPSTQFTSSGLQVRKDLVNCWCILLGQKADEKYCCVNYIEDHVELLDFLVGW
jgi:calcium binding protein 39